MRRACAPPGSPGPAARPTRAHGSCRRSSPKPSPAWYARACRRRRRRCCTAPAPPSDDSRRSPRSSSSSSLLQERGRRLLGQGRRAEAAELEALRVLLSAGGAGRHRTSLGARTADFTPRPLESRFSPNAWLLPVALWNVPDQKFAEPVALSSTQPADRPLPRRALRLGLDLVALRARRTRNLNDCVASVKGLQARSRLPAPLRVPVCWHAGSSTRGASNSQRVPAAGSRSLDGTCQRTYGAPHPPPARAGAGTRVGKGRQTARPARAAASARRS